MHADAVYTCIMGTKGTGKTLTLRRMYARVIEAGGRATFVDTNSKNSDLAQLAGPRDAVRGVVRSAEGWFSHVRSALAEGRPFNLVIQPDWSAEINGLWRMVYEVGHSFTAIDEAEGYANARRIDPNLAKLISRGRNQQCSLGATVRVPPELSKLLRGMADVTMSFRQESSDYADDVARESFHRHRSAAAILVKLPRFAYLHYRSASGVLSVGKIDPP